MRKSSPMAPKIDGKCIPKSSNMWKTKVWEVLAMQKASFFEVSSFAGKHCRCSLSTVLKVLFLFESCLKLVSKWSQNWWTIDPKRVWESSLGKCCKNLEKVCPRAPKWTPKSIQIPSQESPDEEELAFHCQKGSQGVSGAQKMSKNVVKMVPQSSPKASEVVPKASKDVTHERH